MERPKKPLSGGEYDEEHRREHCTVAFRKHYSKVREKQVVDWQKMVVIHVDLKQWCDLAFLGICSDLSSANTEIHLSFPKCGSRKWSPLNIFSDRELNNFSDGQNWRATYILAPFEERSPFAIGLFSSRERAFPVIRFGPWHAST